MRNHALVRRHPDPLRVKLGEIIQFPATGPRGRNRQTPRSRVLKTAAAIMRDALLALVPEDSVTLEAVPSSTPEEGTMLLLCVSGQARVVLIVPASVIRSKRLLEARKRHPESESVFERMRLSDHHAAASAESLEESDDV